MERPFGNEKKLTCCRMKGIESRNHRTYLIANSLMADDYSITHDPDINDILSLRLIP
jgi:hypothetical protein